MAKKKNDNVDLDNDVIDEPAEPTPAAATTEPTPAAATAAKTASYRVISLNLFIHGIFYKSGQVVTLPVSVADAMVTRGQLAKVE